MNKEKRYANYTLPNKLFTNKTTLIIRVIMAFSIITILVMFILSLNNISKIRNLLKREMYTYLSEVSIQGANDLNKQISEHKNLLESIALNLHSYNSSDPKLLFDTLLKQKESNDFKKIGIVTLDGTAYTTNGHTDNFSGNEYFNKAIHGYSSVSSAMATKVDEGNVIVYFTPVFVNNKVSSVLFATYDSSLYDSLLNTSFFKENGVFYICNSNGDIILSPNNQKNTPTIKNIYTTLKSKDITRITPNKIATMTSNLHNGKSGSINYKINDKKRALNYMPLYINDWNLLTVISIDVMVERILHIIKVVFYLCILIITIFSALLLLLFYIYSRNKKIISSLVFVDSVTGGFNLNKFQIESKNILISNPNKDYALVVLDVNNFKYINDVFGYNEGNRLICHISNMLIQNLNKHEICGRVNNDIFSILVEFLGEDHLLHRLNIISNNISNIDSSFVINHNITINCGIYVIDDKNIDIYHMIDMATLAITTIKGGSKSAYVFFNEDIRLKLNEGKEIEISMESALDNKEFQIYIQPKFNLKNRNIIGAEALIRWSHPVKGMISPDNFIPIFEKNGFISKIDTYVFEEVCKQIQEQINNGYTPIPISVNFSRVHISNLNLIYTYKELAEKYNIPTHLIEIEITENFAIDNTNALQNIIIKLKQMGFTVSMDDFGSGYSSLNMLKDIPVDVLKLDKNFLHENSNNDRGKIIISNIITMAKQLDMKVICEGVELESQANFLEEMGCDAAQGFFFDRPMPINIFNKKFY